MSCTENEYRETVKRFDQIREVIEKQKTNLRELGLKEDQIEKAIHPSICFHDQLKEEADSYEKTH